jgi:hypothetical protein
MRKLLLAAALLLPLTGNAEVKDQYNIDKFTKIKAENVCTTLASVTLHPSAYHALVLHIEPETAGLLLPDREGYFVATVYKYRTDGVTFFCIFRDFRTKGLIQLVEFGNIGGDTGDVTTIVNKLF